MSSAMVRKMKLAAARRPLGWWMGTAKSLLVERHGSVAGAHQVLGDAGVERATGGRAGRVPVRQVFTLGHTPQV